MRNPNSIWYHSEGLKRSFNWEFVWTQIFISSDNFCVKNNNQKICSEDHSWVVYSVFFSNTVLNQIVTSIPRFVVPTDSFCKALQTCQGSQGLVIIDPETQIMKFCLSGLGNKNSSYVTLLVLEDIYEHHYALFFVTSAQLSSIFLHL